MKIVNLTQHPATPEQIAQDVFDLPQDERERIGGLLTFDEIPSADDLRYRAKEIAYTASRWLPRAAMIGGAPFLMALLEQELREQCITPVYAFSRRESVEELQTDGAVKKVNVFRHLGFVEV
jgi:hypothetical protein